MTERAERLIEFLEREYGWTVYDSGTRCKKHGPFSSIYKYCPLCKNKLEEIPDIQTIEDVEYALQYALKE